VKRSTEKAQLAMAGSDVTRGQLSLDFARTRLAEAAAMPGDDAAISGVLADMDADTKQGVQLLTGSAVTRKQTAPLSRVDGFVAGQRQILEPMLDRLSPDNRERAAASMTLLQHAHDRADDLRAGLACGTITSAGSDVLGPKLKDCVSGTNEDSAESDEPTSQGEEAGRTSSDRAGETEDAPEKKPAADDPTADPATTGKADQPSDDSRTKPGVGATTDDQTTKPVAPPAEEPADTEDDGLLGKLLPNIF
jgi:hypothetical protein